MSTVEQEFSKDFPDSYKTMNDTTAPIMSRAIAESTFNVYKKGWNAAKRVSEAEHYRGRQRVRRLIQAGKEYE